MSFIPSNKNKQSKILASFYQFDKRLYKKKFESCMMSIKNYLKELCTGLLIGRRRARLLNYCDPLLLNTSWPKNGSRTLKAENSKQSL